MESVASETNKKLNEEEEHDDEESPIEEHGDEDCPIEEHVEEESLIEEQVDEESPIEEHGDEESPIEEHDDTESPIEEEHVDEESPIEEHVEEESPTEEHDDEESPIEEHDDEECPIEEHVNDESPIEEHDDKECPIEEYDDEECPIEEHVDEESPIEEHDDVESFIKEHDDTESPIEEEHVDEESPIEEHVEEKCPIEEHDDEESPIEEHDDEECPIEEHDDEESPIKEHDDTESPIEEEHVDEESPIEEHDDEENPIEEHDDEESTIEEHDDEECPIEEHVNEESPIEEHVDEESPMEEHVEEESPIEVHVDEESPIEEHDDEESPIEEVRSTVPTTDDSTQSVWTFRMWVLGLASCVLLACQNQFFSYQASPLIITQLATLALGRRMAALLPTSTFGFPGCGSRKFSLNPGPFNMKEHVLITIFANAGAAFGSGSAYAVGIVNIIKAFYGRNVSFIAAWLLIITTQVLGYGWAGLLRKYVVEPSHMWWPGTLVQVSLFRTLHAKEDDDEDLNSDTKKRMSRSKFFVIVFVCSFGWYLLPGYFFQTLKSISWVCWAFPNSVTAHQLGSGFTGLGIGAFSLDWATTASFLFSPLISPFFAIANVFLGYILIMYLVIPISYWRLNLYNAKNFPIYSSSLFTANGHEYDITKIVNRKFEIDYNEYGKQGKVNLSTFFLLTYGFGFATIASTLTHVGLFYGKEIYQRYKASTKGKVDVHTRLMRNYKDIPSWWFYVLLTVTLMVSLALTLFMKDQIQMPFWGLILAAVLAFCFTLPISIITATTNQTPGLNIITEYAMGLIYPGKPIANVCFKTYGYMSMTQAIYFLSDFKLGHYMKIPPRSMFLVQVLGTIIAGTVNLGVAWYLLSNMDEICHPDPKSNSPWTCPVDTIFFDASVIWGLVGPKRIFGPLGNYGALNWFFLGGIMGPVVVWLCHKALPSVSWIPLINLPVLLGATAYMPLTGAVTYNSWILVGTIFNFFVFRYRKMWWKRYNYILSAALDAGVASMDILLYFTTGLEDKTVHWWGADNPQHCDLATCPTAKGLNVTGCPVF